MIANAWNGDIGYCKDTATRSAEKSGFLIVLSKTDVYCSLSPRRLVSIFTQLYHYEMT